MKHGHMSEARVWHFEDVKLNSVASTCMWRCSKILIYNTVQYTNSDGKNNNQPRHHVSRAIHLD